MANNFLKYTVIFLAVLIFLCFAFLLYGLYSKISNTQVLSINDTTSYSLDLNIFEKIIDVKIIDENSLLIVTSEDGHKQLIVYSIKKNNIISKIGR